MEERSAAPGRREVRRGVRLTARQLEVLALLCQGLPNKLICRQLNISPATVNTHISAILAELGVSSRLQAVIVAQRDGLLVDAESVADSDTPDTARDLAAAGLSPLTSGVQTRAGLLFPRPA
ncbi:MAG TPA: LuxR C-terminal-related transcriptional regulator [Burkholderiales bacterium]|nr:LuxR C-terminal-related transcriptional regulator [Burkholderiales bacterium]